MTSIKIGLLSLTVQRIRGLAMESSGKYSMAGSKYRENGPWAKECGQPLKAGKSHGRNVSHRDVLILASWTSHPQIIKSPFQAVNLWQLVRGRERRETLPDLTPVSRLLVCHTITLTWQPCSHTRVLGQLTLSGSSTPFHLTISYPLWSQPSSSWRKAFPDTAQTQLNFASRASQPQERMLCPFQLLEAARFPFHVHRSNFKLSKCKS